jgi:predicted short-subunit dehydrogenase-like oxidoreductase (DUF2520 family)
MSALPRPHPAAVPAGSLTVGVIGAGRVGAVLGAALAAAGHRVVAASGVSAAARARIGDLLPGAAHLPAAEVARAGADLLLLAVPDDALPGVAADLARRGAVRSGQYVVHTSGFHGLAVLSSLAARGARTIAMHPVMTFTGTDVDLGRLSGCVLGVTADPSSRGFVEELAADLGARPAWIEEADRPLYHAALAHGANHLVTLVAQVMELLRSAGTSDPGETLRPLLSAALDNALAYGDAALTGPIVRGDAKTVAAHLRRLAGADPEALQAYVALARATVQRAVADRRLDPARAGAVLEALADAAVGASA